MSKKIIYTCDICGKKEEEVNGRVPYGWITTSGGQNKCLDCIGKPYPDDELCICGHYKYQSHYPEMGKNLPCEVCDCQEFTPVKEKD